MVIHESHSINEHKFYGNFPDESGTSSIILVVYKTMVVQGLTNLSDKFPKSVGTEQVSPFFGTGSLSLSPYPQWDNIPRSFMTRYQNYGPSIAKKEDDSEKINDNDRPLC